MNEKDEAALRTHLAGMNEMYHDGAENSFEAGWQACAASQQAEPVAWRTLGYVQGVEAVAKMLDAKADDYAKEFGFDDMGGLEFSRESQREYHSTLVELAEEVRSIVGTPPAPAVAQPPAEVVRELMEALRHAQKVMNFHNLATQCTPINTALKLAKEHGL